MDVTSPPSTDANSNSTQLAIPNQSNPSNQPNKLIRVGFYDIGRTIGRGNFAIVKLSRHRITKSEVSDAFSYKK